MPFDHQHPDRSRPDLPTDAAAEAARRELRDGTAARRVAEAAAADLTGRPDPATGDRA